MCNAEKEIIMLERAKAHIKFSEGYRDNIYLDSRGFVSGGWGHCLNSVKPYRSIRDYWEELFAEDFDRARLDTERFIKEYGLVSLSCVRKSILLDMLYNMGYRKLSKFNRLIQGLRTGDYNLAVKSMEDSLWYAQVGKRSKRLVEAMATDTYPIIPGGGYE